MLNRLKIISCIGLISFLVACAAPSFSQSQNKITSTTFTLTAVMSGTKETVLPKTLNQTATHLAVTPSSTKMFVTPTASITPTIAIIPTHTPSLTSTPQPPLTAHTWTAKQVLVQMETGNGDGGGSITNPPRVVLYSNGLFIRAKEIGPFQYEMMGRKLKRQEICTFLNTLDQVGFLDYDHSVYKSPFAGAPSTFIVVNAWNSNGASGPLLDRWITEGSNWWEKECPGCQPAPVILPALANAYKLIENYDPGDLQPLPVNKLVLWIVPAEKALIEPINPLPWPVTDISLSKLSALAKEEKNFAVLIEDRLMVEAIQQSVKNGFYQQEGQVWQITFRPYWPSETHFGISTDLPTPALIVPAGTTLSCRPEDGVVPIP